MWFVTYNRMTLLVLGVLFTIGGVVAWGLSSALHVMGAIWFVVGLLMLGWWIVAWRRTRSNARIEQAGKQAEGVVVAIRDTGTTINYQPQVEMRLRIEPPGEQPFEVTRKLVVSRIDPPHVGSRLSIRYDPAHPEHWVQDDAAAQQAQVSYAPAPAPPQTAPATDSVSKLEHLADMKARGLLTEAEFETEKAKVLAEG